MGFAKRIKLERILKNQNEDKLEFRERQIKSNEESTETLERKFRENEESDRIGKLESN